MTHRTLAAGIALVMLFRATLSLGGHVGAAPAAHVRPLRTVLRADSGSAGRSQPARRAHYYGADRANGGKKHEHLDMGGPAGRVFAAWATPRYGDADADYLSLFVEVLAAPEAGRLDQQLVSRDRLAGSTAADIGRLGLVMSFCCCSFGVWLPPAARSTAPTSWRSFD